MPKDEQVAVRYPTGFRRTNNDGEELFMLLIRNLWIPSRGSVLGERTKQSSIERIQSGWLHYQILYREMYVLYL